jgi:hypothetical protein
MRVWEPNPAEIVSWLILGMNSVCNFSLTPCLRGEKHAAPETRP